ncbi:hypothetical protein G6L37_35175 [Agrobacterium rubi]|nr:hypothetical protein [Agrobacterium rubi]NTF23813.1 hypothetical protein [Agrobacterium rubi]
MEHQDSSLNAAKKPWFTARQRFWLDVVFVVAVIAMVVVTHLVTKGSHRGFLLGTGQTTAAGALALALLLFMLGSKIMQYGRKQQGNTAFRLVMVGAVVYWTGALPLPLFAFDLHHRMMLIEAKMAAFSQVTRVGRLAEKHPQDARKIGNIVGLEIMHETFGPGFSAEWENENAAKIEARWKELGFDKSPDL